MKSIRTIGVLSALLMAVSIVVACLPARSAESVILYVRNQPYTQPTVQENGELYASFSGILKALRFGWLVQGTTLTILPSGHPGAPITAAPAVVLYRGKRLSLPMRTENGAPWVSVPALARAVGAGYQANNELHTVDVYFVRSADAAVPPAPPAPSPTAPAAQPPAVTASGSPQPAVAGTGAPAASPSAEAAAAPSPTPQPDVAVSHSEVVPDWTNGRLVATIEVQNPADVPAKDVNVRVTVMSGEGQSIYTQNVYIGDMAPHQQITRSVEGSHPDGSSMPRSLYRADTQVTFNR